jgi:hypothetical protein
MRKFLKLIESHFPSESDKFAKSNFPEQSYEEITKAKNALARFLISRDINAIPIKDKNRIDITLPGNKEYIISIVSAPESPEEENEQEDTGDLLRAINSVPDDPNNKDPNNKKIQDAKKTIADKATEVATKIKQIQ